LALLFFTTAKTTTASNFTVALLQVNPAVDHAPFLEAPSDAEGERTVRRAAEEQRGGHRPARRAPLRLRQGAHVCVGTARGAHELCAGAAQHAARLGELPATRKPPRRVQSEV